MIGLYWRSPLAYAGFMYTNGQQERPTTSEPRDVPRSEPPTDQVRLTVAQTAVALGITEGAVRSRIKRGTLPVVKESGTVFVVWGDGTPETNHTTYQEAPSGEPTDVPPGEPSDQPYYDSELVESLRDQVEYLKGQLDSEREAGRRKDHLLARALERIPAIESGETPGASEPGAETSGSGDVPPAPEKPSSRSWWRRLFA